MASYRVRIAKALLTSFLQGGCTVALREGERLESDAPKDLKVLNVWARMDLDAVDVVFWTTSNLSDRVVPDGLRPPLIKPFTITRVSAGRASRSSPREPHSPVPVEDQPPPP